MPISPSVLFERVGIVVNGTVPWGSVPATDAPGIYAISLCADPTCNGELLADAPLDVSKVAAWLNRVPTFCFRGVVQPPAQIVADFLKTFWLEDESIIYIGKATRLRERLGQYRGHRLGDRRPHAGGHWIKTLSNLQELFIHFAVVDSESLAAAKEGEALARFKMQVSSRHRARLRNPIPFANRAHPSGNNKQHDIRADVLA